MKVTGYLISGVSMRFTAKYHFCYEQMITAFMIVISSIRVICVSIVYSVIITLISLQSSVDKSLYFLPLPIQLLRSLDVLHIKFLTHILRIPSDLVLISLLKTKCTLTAIVIFHGLSPCFILCPLICMFRLMPFQMAAWPGAGHFRTSLTPGHSLTLAHYLVRQGCQRLGMSSNGTLLSVFVISYYVI